MQIIDNAGLPVDERSVYVERQQAVIAELQHGAAASAVVVVALVVVALFVEVEIDADVFGHHFFFSQDFLLLGDLFGVVVGQHWYFGNYHFQKS